MIGVAISFAIAVVFAIAFAVRGASWQKLAERMFAARRTGGIPAARAELDKTWKPPTRGDRVFSLRLCAMTLIGDRDGLAREVAMIDGPPRVICYHKTFGLLGLVLLGDPSAPARLAEHAEKMERELPRIMGKIKAAIREVSAIGAAVTAGPTDAIAKMRPDLYPFVTQWHKFVIWSAVVRAFERDGKTEWANNARTRLSGFDKLAVG